MEKLCWLCKHIAFDSGWGGSDVTPGDPAVFECGKLHWNAMDDGDPKHLRECLAKAENCPDFTPHDYEEPSSKAINIRSSQTGGLVKFDTSMEDAAMFEVYGRDLKSIFDQGVEAERQRCFRYILSLRPSCGELTKHQMEYAQTCEEIADKILKGGE